MLALLQKIVLVMAISMGFSCHWVFPYKGSAEERRSSDAADDQRRRDTSSGDGARRDDGSQRPRRDLLVDIARDRRVREASAGDLNRDVKVLDLAGDTSADLGKDLNSAQDLAPLDVAPLSDGLCTGPCSPDCPCPDGQICNIEGECWVQTTNCLNISNWVCSEESVLQCRATCHDTELICTDQKCSCQFSLGSKSCNNDYVGEDRVGCGVCAKALELDECCHPHT